MQLKITEKMMAANIPTIRKAPTSGSSVFLKVNAGGSTYPNTSTNPASENAF